MSRILLSSGDTCAVVSVPDILPLPPTFIFLAIPTPPLIITAPLLNTVDSVVPLTNNDPLF